MIRQVAIALAAVALTMGLGVPALAVQTGSIRVSMDYGGAASGGEVVLQTVAEAIEGGYRLKETFGGGVIRIEDACSPELAQWLSERSVSGGISQQLDAEGNVEFSGLEKGLYLVIQTDAAEGWSCVAPFLVPLPLNGEWEILACPKQAVLLTQSPRTGQHPAPIFGAMGLVLSGMGLYLCVEKLRKK